LLISFSGLSQAITIQRELNLQADTMTENEETYEQQLVYAEELSDAVHEETCEMSEMSKEMREEKVKLLKSNRDNSTKCTCNYAEKLAAKQVSKEPLPLDKTQRSVAEANL
jgi:hypothetical protein